MHSPAVAPQASALTSCATARTLCSTGCRGRGACFVFLALQRAERLPGSGLSASISYSSITPPANFISSSSAKIFDAPPHQRCISFHFFLRSVMSLMGSPQRREYALGQRQFLVFLALVMDGCLNGVLFYQSLHHCTLSHAGAQTMREKPAPLTESTIFSRASSN